MGIKFIGGVIMKRCILCGKLFCPKANAQKICEDTHYRVCVCCGKPFKISRPSDYRRCCSKKCSVELRKTTMINRFGVSHPLKDETFLRKREQTNLKKFGYKYAAQNPEVKEMERRIFQERYGVDTPFLMKDFLDKSKKTCMEKYGVEYTSQIPNRKKKTLNDESL